MPDGVRPRQALTVPAEVDVRAFAQMALRPMPLTVIGGGGYVGAITAVGLAHLGHPVVAVDINHERVEQLARGEPPFHEPLLPELLNETLRTGRLRFVALDALTEVLEAARLVFIAVNTPRRNDGEVDLSDIIRVASDLGPALTRHTVVVLKSTTPVGSHLIIHRVLEQYGRQESVDYDLVANPEFLREGSALQDFFYPDRVVIGGRRPEAVFAVRKLFEPLGAPILETTFENAQMIKYAANAFLATRVSFINEIANICERVGAEVDVVARGLGYDRRIGHAYLRAGIGFSGPCLPKDLEGLIRLSEDSGYEPLLLKAVMEKNAHQRRQILAKVYALLGTALYGRRIAVWGLAFKAGTNDTRNSAAPVIVDHLVRRGAEVSAYDPMVDGDVGLSGRIVRTPYEAVEGADLLLILTACPEFEQLDFSRVFRLMRAANIVDGVNILNPSVLRTMAFLYVGVGQLTGLATTFGAGTGER